MGLSGCWASQNTAASTEYARQVTTANLRVAQLENALSESAARIEQLEEFVRAQGKSQATRLQNLDEVNAEVTRLRGQIEVIQFDLEAIKKGLAESGIQSERRHLHAERRLQQLETELGFTPPPPPTNAELGLEGPDDPSATPDEGPAPDPLESVPDTAKGKLELANQRLAEDKPKAARIILERALEAHPDAAEIDEILYRIAESHFNEGDFRTAALAFRTVRNDHPDSPWSSWAMLRQGECFEGLGQKDNARMFYDGVVENHRGTEAAAEAARRLKR